MRILVISAAFPPLPAGESDYTLQVCEGLARRGHAVEVLTMEGPQYPSLSGVTVSAVMRGWGWTAMRALARHIKRARPDVILLHYLGWLYGRHPMITHAPAIAKHAAPGAAFVTLFFNAMGARSQDASRLTMGAHYLAKLARGRRYSGFEFGTLLHDSDRLIVFSDRHRRALAGNCAESAARTELIPAFPLVRCAAGEAAALRRAGREKLGLGQDDFVFVNFGYAYPGKGLDILLPAFERVMRKGQRPARLVLVGGNLAKGYTDWTSYGECLKSLAWALRIDSKVTWAGGYAWDSEDPSLYLHAADAAVLPFDVGLALNNSSAATAVGHALPLLSTVSGELEPAFVPGTNCLLAPPRDPALLAGIMTRVMEDETIRAHLAAGATALAREWFSAEKAIGNIERVLLEAGSLDRRSCPERDSLPQEV